MTKPRIATVWLDGCSGCHMSFLDLDERLTGVRTSWPDLVHDCKLDVATGMLGAELRRMAALAPVVRLRRLHRL